MVEYYKNASQEERALMDSIAAPAMNISKDQQVKQICGINFGISLSEARRVLTNKFGEPMYDPNSSNILSFENVKYAGISFDAIHFLKRMGSLDFWTMEVESHHCGTVVHLTCLEI